MDLSEKLKILTDGAKYDVACTSSGVDRSNKGKGMGDAHACGICHTLRQMAVVYRYLRYFIQMNVFMTASIVLTESQMMFQEPVLHPMKFVSLPWNFIDAIILKDYF